LSKDNCQKMRNAVPECTRQLSKCYETQKPDDCNAADKFCSTQIYEIFDQTSGLNCYDIRTSNLTSYTYPPEDYLNYLNQSTVTKQIGAKKLYVECSNTVYDGFANNGENALSSANDVKYLLNNNIRILLYYGDQDFMCNW
ncbi:7333_t:CDS:2, partial [Ambispora leptoticha]